MDWNVTVGELLRDYREGWTLPGRAYTEPALYEHDVSTFWRKDWIFVAHLCELRQPGDFVAVEVAGDSLLVVRQDGATVAALHNVCPHRGSIVTEQRAGHCRRFVCPYHQWTFDLKGRLRAAPGLDARHDRADLGLRRAHVRELAGLIFVSTAENPTDFGPVAATVGPMLQPQGLAGARIAHSEEYVVEANWKVLWENHAECLHCVSNHPEYVKANFDRFGPNTTPPHVNARIAAIAEANRLRWGGTALEIEQVTTGFPSFPDREEGRWYGCERTALVEGWATESVDGRLVAPYMGEYSSYDVGTLRVRVLPNLWLHGNCDYAVTTALFPDGPTRTRARVTWLVAAAAQEGADYDRERLVAIWKATSEQDWLVCRRQQAGLSSSAYRPGPLSEESEYNVIRFLSWYVKRLGG
jgi:Rieske 2Fe-2S family protein